MGASRQVAELLTDAALFAEDRGKSVVGVSHLLDYVDAIHDGRLDGRAIPLVSRPCLAIVASDARGGIAHTGFEEGFAGLAEAARQCGVAVFAQQGSFTCGQLGWFTERLADVGLVAVATAVSPALLASASGGSRVFGTNPVAYSVPRAECAPFPVDQASSSISFVTVRDAAARDTLLPEGSAVDVDGHPTKDPEAALAGALLPFGGYKGANIALLVELLSSMAGGHWSMDAPAWDTGSQHPSAGMFVLAVDHNAFAPDYPARVDEHLERLASSGVRLSGSSAEPPATADGRLTLRADVLDDLCRRAGHTAPHQQGKAGEGRGPVSVHDLRERTLRLPRYAERGTRHPTRTRRRTFPADHLRHLGRGPHVDQCE